MKTPEKPSRLFPCLRATMGDWWYYVTTMTLDEVNTFVKPIDKIHVKTELKTWLQREIADERLSQIADYLISQKQHFFNAIVAGIYEGKPTWYPLDVGDNPAMPTVHPQARARDAFGFLSLTGKEQIFAIDGQHRVEGIRAALSRKSKLGKEQQCVLFVGHSEDEKGRARTRRLFSTLNKYAKPVSKGELVALSEDDTFAVVTRKLIDDYPPLGIEFVPLTKTANIPPSNLRCVTTVLGLYELTKTITLKPRDARKRALEVGPLKRDAVKEIYTGTKDFWELLRDHVPAIDKVAKSKPDDELASDYRTKKGGHILFRPVGMQAFAKAARTMVNRGKSWTSAVDRLSRTTLKLSSEPWLGVLWNAEANQIITKNGRLAQNLFLYMARERLTAVDYDLLKEYRRALDDPSATLDGIGRI